ncbi:hypothetical protein LZ30DRAFT_124622 [Colletotrichum cereale]|nr:hypothetical protein LZ30DRAFT_124622 [Colletotrichum cereale]
MAPTKAEPHHLLKPLISLCDLLECDAVTDDALMENLTGGNSKSGTGLLLDETQPYDPNTSGSTQSRHRVALKNLLMIRDKFKEPVYYLCLFACSVTALSKDPIKTGFWNALKQWPDRDNIPPDFTEKARGLIKEYHKKTRKTDGGPTSQQKRRRSTTDPTEQVTNLSKRARVRDRQSGQAENEESDAVIDYERRLSVPHDSSPVMREANKRLQRLEASRNSGSDALSYVGPRCGSVSTSQEARSVPRVVAYGGNKEDRNNSEDDDDDNDDEPGNEDHDNDHNDDHDNKDHYDAADTVAEVQENRSYTHNQYDDAAKDPSLLVSHDTFSQHAEQLQMPQLHERQLDVSHGSLQVPLQLHPQVQLQVSQESQFLMSEATTQDIHSQNGTPGLPKFRGYLIPKEYLYEAMAHYTGPVKLLVPLIPNSSPFITIDVSETQAKKFWSGRNRFM